MTNEARSLNGNSPLSFPNCSVLILAFFLLLTAACTPAKSPGRAFEYYNLEYASPVFGSRPQLNELVTVERFSAAQAFNTTAMVYRSAPSVLNTYTYHRWKLPPPEMVTDLVLRDLRQSGLFKAVFSDYDEADARFVLQGRLEEFLEIEETGSRKALLALDITLLDRSRRDSTGGVIFQKGYRALEPLEPLESQTPVSFARAMSRALEELSRRITEDIHSAVRGSKA